MKGSEQRQPGPGPLASHSHGAELDTRSLGVSKGNRTLRARYPRQQGLSPSPDMC